MSDTTALINYAAHNAPSVYQRFIDKKPKDQLRVTHVGTGETCPACHPTLSQITESDFIKGLEEDKKLMDPYAKKE